MKRIWILALAVLMLVFAPNMLLRAEAAEIVDSGTCGENLTWELTDNGDLHISGIGNMPFYDVDADVPWDNYREAITSVTIDEGVTSIGYCIFYECVNLTTATIPKSVSFIELSAFSFCTSLTDIFYGGTEKGWMHVEIGDDNEPLFNATIHPDMLSDDIYDENLIPNDTIPLDIHTSGICGENLTWTLDSEGTLSISGTGDMVYRNGGMPWATLTNNIRKLELSEGITSICDYAFWQLRYLSSVTIPSTVTSIGMSAFEECFGLKEVITHDGITDIDLHAFARCTNLKEFKIPANLTILYGTFYECTSLTSITIPDSVTSIGGCAFFGCSSLASITIPDSVTSIGDCAFARCASLTSLTIPDGVTYIGDEAFERCTSLTSLTIPDGITSIGTGTFSRCSSLTSITIPDSVTSIGMYAFSGCSSLTEITIPKGVTSIGDSAFRECSLLTSILIPKGVTSIADYTFLGCSSLAGIVIPENVTSIGMHAFSGCSSLTNIMIPENVTSIGTQAFEECNNLTEIIFPAGVTDIDLMVFNNNSLLEHITFLGNAPKINDNAFLNFTATIYYPADNATWTADKLKNYGGKINWIPFFDPLKDIVQSNMSSEEILLAVQSMDTNELKSAIQADIYNTNTVNDIAQLEAQVGGPALVEVTASASDFDASNVSIVGANLNKSGVSSEQITLIIDKPERENVIPKQYDNAIAVKFSMDLRNAADSKNLAVPVKITLPVPETINPVFLVILHYHADGSFEEIRPNVYQDGDKYYASFILTSFSDFTMTEYVENPNSFIDVEEDAYYFESVLWAVENGVTNGLSADTFGPDATCTRAQIVTFLWRANGSPAPASGNNPFTDVPAGQWYTDAVLWAVEKGITSGTSATTFSPDAGCTRGQVATFLWRAEGEPTSGAENIFTDIIPGAYYYDAVLWAVENGVTNGIGEGLFAPDATCTRGQIVTFLYRAVA